MKTLPIILALCLLSSTAMAAVTPTQEQTANQLLSSGKAPEAYRLLRPLISEGDSAQSWALLGKSAELSGDINAAIAAYREVLKRDPNANRVKLDLARLLAARGDRDESERLFREVRSINPPAQVAANIDRYLAMLNDRDKVGSAFRFRASIGTGYESNANQATKAKTIMMFGLPFDLSKDARRKGSAFITVKAELDHIYRFNREFAWTSSVSLGARKYLNIDSIDNYSLYASTGPVIQPGDKTTILLPVFTSISRFENSKVASNKRFHSNEYGFAPQIRYAFASNLDLNLTGTLSRRHFFEQNRRDATVSTLTPGIDFKSADFGTFSLGGNVGREVSDQRIYSNKTIGGNIGWQKNITEKCAAALYGQYANVRYDEMEIMYSEKRNDKRFVAGGDLICSIEAIAADLTLSYQRTWNTSNLPIYSYQKDMISVSLRKIF